MFPQCPICGEIFASVLTQLAHKAVQHYPVQSAFALIGISLLLASSKGRGQLG